MVTYILFGTSVCEAYREDGIEGVIREIEDLAPYELKRETFRSKKEKDAFIRGMNAMNDWCFTTDFSEITTKDFRTLIKFVRK